MPAAEPVVTGGEKARNQYQEKEAGCIQPAPENEAFTGLHMHAEEAPTGKADDSRSIADRRKPQERRVRRPRAGTARQWSGSGAPYDTSFGQADAPRFLEYVQPKYPLAARQQGREGTVVLRLTIDEKGNLVQVEVISSPSDGFAQSAVEAVKRSTFAPAQRGGKAVASRAVLPMRFALRR